ncbi:hypothetical protein DLB55_22870 [Salmonella enterica subsp. enterica]|nr:hypothetical protein [Salmonella enterica subsp. enterica]
MIKGPLKRPFLLPAISTQRQRCVVIIGSLLDLFMGDGSAGVSALLSCRKFSGIEMSEHYFDIACERMDKANEAKNVASASGDR